MVLEEEAKAWDAGSRAGTVMLAAIRARDAQIRAALLEEACEREARAGEFGGELRAVMIGHASILRRWAARLGGGS